MLIMFFTLNSQENLATVTVLHIYKNTWFCWKLLLQNKVESDEAQFNFKYLVTNYLM